MDINGISASHGISMAKSLGLYELSQRHGILQSEHVITSDWTASWGVTGVPFFVINRIMENNNLDELLTMFRAGGQYYSTLGRSVIVGDPPMLHSETLTVLCGEFDEKKEKKYREMLNKGLLNIAGGADIIQMIVTGILQPPYKPGKGRVLSIESRLYDPISLSDARQYVKGVKKAPPNFERNSYDLELDVDGNEKLNDNEQTIARLRLSLMGFRQCGIY